MLRLIIIVSLLLAGSAAQAEPVALLPLDADARLALYGQPVASEIARALVAGGVEVIVLGPKTAMPEHVRLVVFGSIKAKGAAITLTIGLRDPSNGTQLGENVAETAANLAQIDRAASQMSARLLPIVQQQLAILAAKPPDKPVIDRPPPPPPPPISMMLVGVSGDFHTELLRGALVGEMGQWAARQNRWQIQPADPSQLVRVLAPGTVKQQSAKSAIAFEILDYSVFIAKRSETLGSKVVPLAQARIRVRMSDGENVRFERVVVTDTIVGDAQMPVDALAARVAREVIGILRPHMKRVEASWR